MMISGILFGFGFVIGIGLAVVVMLKILQLVINRDR